MSTKEQERKALEQIRKIVEGLGENSYIGTAFEGCFEIAEENIDNDWGCSMKQRCEINEKEAEAAEKMVNDLQKKNYALKAKAEEAEARFNAAQIRAAELEDEIIKLKAKLYDMMVATA